MNEIKAEISFCLDGSVIFTGKDSEKAALLYNGRIAAAENGGRNEVVNNIIRAIEKIASGHAK